MRRVLATLAALVVVALGASGASALSPNLPPAIVIGNGDGTVMISTAAVPNGGCIGAVSPTKYACNIRIVGSGAATYYTDGGPTIIAGPFYGCPCTAQFWVHAGQWHAYSAMSPAFIP